MTIKNISILSSQLDSYQPNRKSICRYVTNLGNSFDTFDTIILNMQLAPDPPKIFSRVSE